MTFCLNVCNSSFVSAKFITIVAKLKKMLLQNKKTWYNNKKAEIAQLVEQRTENPRVTSSSLVLGKIIGLGFPFTVQKNRKAFLQWHPSSAISTLTYVSDPRYSFGFREFGSLEHIANVRIISSLSYSLLG